MIVLSQVLVLLVLIFSCVLTAYIKPMSYENCLGMTREKRPKAFRFLFTLSKISTISAVAGMKKLRQEVRLPDVGVSPRDKLVCSTERIIRMEML